MEQNNMLTITYNKHITKKKTLHFITRSTCSSFKSPSLRIAIYKHNYKYAKKKNFFANFECNIPELIKFSIPW